MQIPVPFRNTCMGILEQSGNLEYILFLPLSREVSLLYMSARNVRKGRLKKRPKSKNSEEHKNEKRKRILKIKKAMKIR